MFQEDIIREIIIISNNRLVLKIWFLLKQFAGEPYRRFNEREEKEIWIHAFD